MSVKEPRAAWNRQKGGGGYGSASLRQQLPSSNGLDWGQGRQEAADLLESGFGITPGESGESATQLKKITAAGEHQFVVASFDRSHSEAGGNESEFRNLE